MALWPMSWRYTLPGKPTAATPRLAACRAVSKDDLTAVTVKTRPPLDTTAPSFRVVPAWKTCSPMSWTWDRPEDRWDAWEHLQGFIQFFGSVCKILYDLTLKSMFLFCSMFSVLLLLFCAHFHQLKNLIRTVFILFWWHSCCGGGKFKTKSKSIQIQDRATFRQCLNPSNPRFVVRCVQLV